jgi:NTE family protein
MACGFSRWLAAIGALLWVVAGWGAALAEPEEEAPPAERPRLALVLSGGGARGAAHIGVLEVLEEMRIPVDVITGTSMGSVVGGLYAAGLSPEELSDAIQGTDWVAVFDDHPSRDELSFRRKQDDRSLLTDLRLAFKDWAFFIPSGIVEGQKLDFLLRTLTLTPDGLARIENLPIPFRAVATDIVTGEAFVFSEGPLAVAQRTSMSIPAAFTPVILGDRMLVDGFVANNLPIDVAQDLGADAVIAVDISTPLMDREDLDDALDISGQVSTFPVQDSQQRQIERLGEHDVVLTPELGDIGAASFPRMAEAIESGRKAALEAAPRLARYAVGEAEYASWRARQRRPRQELPVIDAIRFENRSHVSDRVISSRVGTKVGERLDLEQLRHDLSRLFGMDAFEHVRFDLHREGEDVVLVYELEARARGTNTFQLGLNLESDFGDDSDYNIALRHVFFPMNSWGGELRTDGQVGDTMRFASEFYQELDPYGWFFALPLVSYERRDFDVYQRRERIARFDLEQTISGFQLGANLGGIAQLRGGVGYLDAEARRDIGDPAAFHSESLHGGVYQAVFEFDTLDDTRFPNYGAAASVRSLFIRENMGFDESFEEVTSRGSIFHTWRRNTVGLGFRYSTAIGGRGRVGALNAVGGLFNLSGFDRDSITGRHAGVASLLAYRRIASPAVFAWEFPVYVGGTFEAGNAWEHRSDIDENPLLSSAAFFGVDTPLGPLYIAYAYGENGYHQGYLFLGQSF